MQTDDLQRLQRSIRFVERRLDTFDRALQALRTLTTQRLHRIAASHTANADPTAACPSPFFKRVRAQCRPSLPMQPPSPCLFLLPKPAKRPITPPASAKKVKSEAPRLVSFGEEVESECVQSPRASDSYAITDDSGSDVEISSKKYRPQWAILPDLSVNRVLNPDAIFSELQDDLHKQRKVGFSCHLEDIFPTVRQPKLRGDSANWQMTNL